LTTFKFDRVLACSEADKSYWIFNWSLPYIGMDKRDVEDFYPLRSLPKSLLPAESWWTFMQLDFEMLCKMDINCSIAFDLEDIVYTIWGIV
jgi:hypothetical protein